MWDGCSVLDLCCGDGFYSFYFFSSIAGHIDAVDGNRDAITHAQRFHSTQNIHFGQMNTAAPDFPNANYDVVVWDSAMQYFDPSATRIMCSRIASVTGVLAGSVPLRAENIDPLGERSHFRDLRELRASFAPHFSFVGTLETEHRGGGNIAYFRCSNTEERLKHFSYD
jgi:SAM-dependent methyltransferase